MSRPSPPSSWYYSRERRPGSPDRRRSPPPKGYDRGPPPDWYKWEEWRRRRSPGRGSPPRRTPPRHSPAPAHRSPPPARRSKSPPRRVSPRSERPPPDWVRRSRSPPREYRPEWVRRSPPPRDWPPRRSPIRGPPTRGRTPPRRSPPRGYGPPPDWDRRPPPGFERRLSPPRPYWEKPYRPGAWGPAPPETKAEETKPPDNNGTNEKVESVPQPVAPPEEAKPDTASEEKIDFANYILPDYDPDVPLGQKYVIAVSGFFCKICHKFYNSESSAKITHCKSKTHHDKFSKWVEERKSEAKESAALKRAAEPAPKSDKTQNGPPAKQSKIEEDSKNDSATTATSGEKYDPMEPTLEDESSKTKEKNITNSAKTNPEKGSPIKENVTKNQQEDATQETTSQANTSPETETKPEEVPLEEKEPSVEKMDTQETEPNNPSNEEIEADSQKAFIPIIKDSIDEDGFSADDASSDKQSDADKTDTNGEGIVEATVQNVRKLKVNELKYNLEKRNLKTTGLKPLLLKRLEKALIEEASTMEAEQEENKENSGTNENSDAGDSCLVLKMHESNVEPANHKSHWITRRELERELMQLEGITEVLELKEEKMAMYKKTIVEWTITCKFEGEFPKDGLQFWMASHQQLPFKIDLPDQI